MSNDNKMILKGSAKKVEFDNGGSLINVSLNMEQLIKVFDWYNKERIERGLESTEYFPFAVKQRRNVDEISGSTHYCQFEAWFPEAKAKAEPQLTMGSESSKKDDGGLPF